MREMASAGVSLAQHDRFGTSLVATNTYKSGDVVLAEQPLLVCRCVDSASLRLSGLFCRIQAFFEADEATKRRCLELYSPEPRDVAGSALGEACQSAAALATSSLGLPCAADPLRVALTWGANNFSYGSEFRSSGDGSTSCAAAAAVPALFELGCRIAHTCGPPLLAYRSRDVPEVYRGKGCFVALREIAAGELLTVSYIAAEDGLLLPVALRRVRLWDRLGFWCRCERCEHELSSSSSTIGFCDSLDADSLQKLIEGLHGRGVCVRTAAAAADSGRSSNSGSSGRSSPAPLWAALESALADHVLETVPEVTNSLILFPADRASYVSDEVKALSRLLGPTHWSVSHLRLKLLVPELCGALEQRAERVLQLLQRSAHHNSHSPTTAAAAALSDEFQQHLKPHSSISTLEPSASGIWCQQPASSVAAAAAAAARRLQQAQLQEECDRAAGLLDDLDAAVTASWQWARQLHSSNSGTRSASGGLLLVQNDVILAAKHLIRVAALYRSAFYSCVSSSSAVEHHTAGAHDGLSVASEACCRAPAGAVDHDSAAAVAASSSSGASNSASTGGLHLEHDPAQHHGEASVLDLHEPPRPAGRQETIAGSGAAKLVFRNAARFAREALLLQLLPDLATSRAWQIPHANLSVVEELLRRVNRLLSELS